VLLGVSATSGNELVKYGIDTIGIVPMVLLQLALIVGVLYLTRWAMKKNAAVIDKRFGNLFDKHLPKNCPPCGKPLR